MINTPIALASSSPRRLELLSALDLDVRVIDIHHQESVHPSWRPESVAIELAKIKNEHARCERHSEEILLTADTVVIYQNQILHKPRNQNDAFQYLNLLNNTKHTVITGVCISHEQKIAFSVSTNVWFKKMSQDTIQYYIDMYKPFDKAGGYGIQEWIGWSHVHKIEGSFSNVMGLPTAEVYEGIIKLIG